MERHSVGKTCLEKDSSRVKNLLMVNSDTYKLMDKDLLRACVDRDRRNPFRRKMSLWHGQPSPVFGVRRFFSSWTAQASGTYRGERIGREYETGNDILNPQEKRDGDTCHDDYGV